MANKVRQSLEKRAQQAILQRAVLRWESAAVIAGTLLLSVLAPLFGPIAFIPAWGWLAGGLAAEAAVVYSSLKDEKYAERVVADMLQDEFQPQRLNNPELRRQMEEAIDYHRRLAAAARQDRDSVLQDSLNETVSQVDDWLEEVYRLAQRLDKYEVEKDLIERNLATARRRLRELEKEEEAASGPRLKDDIALNIASLKRKITTMESLENAMVRARLRLEHTLIAMGTIYSQTMLVGAKNIDSSRAQRLRHEIAGEVDELGDILSAMDEVYGGTAVS